VIPLLLGTATINQPAHRRDEGDAFWLSGQVDKAKATTHALATPTDSR
jgi:hypothetical protein